MEIIELLAHVLAAIPYWRTALCFVIGGLLAALAVSVTPWLTFMQGVWLAALSFAPAAAWETAAQQAKGHTSTRPTSKTVAYSAAVLAAAVWGAASSTDWHSIFSGTVILAACSFAWFRHALKKPHWFQSFVARNCLKLTISTYLITTLSLYLVR